MLTSAFDRAGLRAFQALQAPFLIGGYAHERRVIAGPVGARMLAEARAAAPWGGW